MLRIALFRSIPNLVSVKKQKFFSLFIEFLVAENRPSQKNRRPKQKSKKSAKPTISSEVKIIVSPAIKMQMKLFGLGTLKSFSFFRHNFASKVMFLVQNSWPISTANLHNFLIGSLKLVADFNAPFAF